VLIETIEAARYPYSPRVRVLKDILTKFGELGGLSPELAQRLRLTGLRWRGRYWRR